MKRNLSRLICAFITLFLLLTLFSPPAHANTKISDARYGVLRILCNSRHSRSTGTGFIIAQTDEATYIVTNYHVVEDAPDAIYIIPDDIRGDWLQANVVFHQPGLDVVILSVQSGLEDRPALPIVSSETVNFADNIYAIGFPGAADEVIDNSNLLPSSADDVTITNGTVSNPSRKLDDGIFAISSTVALTFGNSGGPLLNEDAQVIGVNTWIYSEGAYGISYSIHSDYIMSMCSQLGIAYSSFASDYPETPPPGTVSPVPTEFATPAPAVPWQDNNLPAVTPSGSSLSISSSTGTNLIAFSLIALGIFIFILAISQRGNLSSWLSAHIAPVVIIISGFIIAIIIGIILPLVFEIYDSANTDSSSVSNDRPRVHATPGISPDVFAPAVTPDTTPVIPDSDTPAPQVLPIAGHTLTGTWELTENSSWLYHFGLSGTIFFLSSGSVYSTENDTWADWYLINGDVLWVVDWFGDEFLFSYTIEDDILTLKDSHGDTSVYRYVINDFTGDWEYAEGAWIWIFGFSWLISFDDDEVYISRVDSTVSWSFSGTENDLIHVWDPESNITRDFRYALIGDMLMLVDEDEDSALFERN